MEERKTNIISIKHRELNDPQNHFTYRHKGIAVCTQPNVWSARRASRVIKFRLGSPCGAGILTENVGAHGDVGFDMGCGPEEDIDLRRAEHERRNRGNPCCSLPRLGMALGKNGWGMSSDVRIIVSGGDGS
ncbi:hypothetical protein CEXT_516031 [Caerostris extrusa]|uniref:Uncharacterized protein n=1 Tax=Caerostris extrusa TaxID=172846 RepID=A0AAV4MS26_CAEEX|nr:hypothetical protein CEXT_516031 [Caerostris extrusa]